MDIEAVIAEAQTSAPSSEATQVAPEAETPPQPIETEEAATEEAQAPKPDAELTPEQLEKREANRRSHANSREAKLKREVRELRELVLKAIPQQNQPQQQPQNNGPTPPDENQFTDWETFRAAERQYYKDLARHEAKQELAEQSKQTTETERHGALQAQTAKRISEIAAKEAEFIKTNPEYVTLYNEHADFMENLNPTIAQALIEADDANLALYTLMKEGKLEELENLSPGEIIKEIAKAEIRGEGYLNRNKATNAPTPVESARGTGNPGKALSNQSVEELMRKFNPR